MAEQGHQEKDLLAGNPRYKKLQDLNEGTFGVVMLALDTYAKEQVSYSGPVALQLLIILHCLLRLLRIL